MIARERGIEYGSAPMHRALVLALLERYRRSGELSALEESSRARIVGFVEREPRCFERSCLEGHLTGSAWILDSRFEHVLLTHHKKLGLWLQPGGHADGDPDPLRVAMREAEEESGIAGLSPLSVELFDIDVHPIPARGAEPMHFHYDLRFALVAPDGATFVVSEESHQLAWVRRDEVRQYATDESVMRMVTKWRPSAGVYSAFG